MVVVARLYSQELEMVSQADLAVALAEFIVLAEVEAQAEREIPVDIIRLKDMQVAAALQADQAEVVVLAV